MDGLIVKLISFYFLKYFSSLLKSSSSSSLLLEPLSLLEDSSLLSSLPLHLILLGVVFVGFFDDPPRRSIECFPHNDTCSRWVQHFSFVSGFEIVVNRPLPFFTVTRLLIPLALVMLVLLLFVKARFVCSTKSSKSSEVVFFFDTFGILSRKEIELNSLLYSIFFYDVILPSRV